METVAATTPATISNSPTSSAPCSATRVDAGAANMFGSDGNQARPVGLNPTDRPTTIAPSSVVQPAIAQRRESSLPVGKRRKTTDVSTTIAGRWNDDDTQAPNRSGVSSGRNAW